MSPCGGADDSKLPASSAAHLLITSQVYARQLVWQAGRIGGHRRWHLWELPHHGCAHLRLANMPWLSSSLRATAWQYTEERLQPCTKAEQSQHKHLQYNDTCSHDSWPHSCA